MHKRVQVALAAAMIGLSGLEGFDVASDGHAAGADGIPELIGRTYGSAAAIDVDGDVLVAAVGGQLVVIDAGDASKARIVGRGRAWPGVVFGLDIVGKRVYAAIGGHGVRVSDVSDLAAPRDIGAFDTPGEAGSVAVAGDLAFVADGGAGLRILDVADPAAIREIGALDTPGDAVGVAVGGDHAYVADFDGGVAAIDVSDPRRPVEVWRQVVAGGRGKVWSVAWDRDHLAVAIDPNTAWLLDVSLPDEPVKLFETNSLGGTRNEIRLFGTKMLVTGPTGLTFIDEGRGWGGGIVGLYSGTRSVGTDGRRVFALTNDGLVVEVDAELAAPYVLGPWLRLVDPVLNIAVGGGRAVASGVGRLTIYDIAERPMPRPLGSFEVLDPVLALSVDGGGFAFVATGSTTYLDEVPKQVRVFDIAPAAGGDPVEVAALTFTETPRDIVVEGRRAYVAFGAAYGNSGNVRYRGGIRVLDVSDPRAPAVVGTLLDTDLYERLAVDGGIVYAVGRRGDVSQAQNNRPFLRVVDATDPAALKVVADRTAASPSTVAYAGLAAGGGRLALYWNESTYYSGISILDASDPSRPGELAAVFVDDMIVDGALRGDRLLLASTGDVRTGANGQRIEPITTVRLRGFDLADTDRLRQTFLVEVPQGDAYAKDLATDGDTIALAAGRHGLWVFDTAGRAAPTAVPEPSRTPRPTASATTAPTRVAPTAVGTGTATAAATVVGTVTPTAQVWSGGRVWLPVAGRDFDAGNP